MPSKGVPQNSFCLLQVSTLPPGGGCPCWVPFPLLYAWQMGVPPPLNVDHCSTGLQPPGQVGLIHPAPTAPSSSQGLPPQVRASSGQQLPGGRSCSWLRHPSLRAEAECRELVAGFPLCHQGQRGGGWQEASPQAAPSLQSPPLLPGRGKGRGALLVPGLFPCCLQTVAPQEHSSLFYR
jgi:hypothetical protein